MQTIILISRIKQFHKERQEVDADIIDAAVEPYTEYGK